MSIYIVWVAYLGYGMFGNMDCQIHGILGVGLVGWFTTWDCGMYWVADWGCSGTIHIFFLKYK